MSNPLPCRQVDLAALEPPTEARLYVRPRVSFAGSGQKGAPCLAGGWACFDSVELLLRGAREIVAATAPLPEALAWANAAGGALEARFDALLARMTAPRPPFAGLDMGAPVLMGVVNVTPDSFSDGGDFAEPDAAIAHGRTLAAEGARILDIGGESTRPGSDAVAEADELARVVPVVSALARDGRGGVISADSRKAAVMAAAAEAGAQVLNDISAFTHDPDALGVAAASGCSVVLMHCAGEPKTMQEAPAYGHAPSEVFDYLEARIAACEAAGIDRARIAVDPGIGFGKTVAHNLALLASLSMLHGLGCPVLLGVSRKSLIAKLTGEERPKARLPGSLAAALAGLQQGVQILRVHDVAETRQAVLTWQAIASGRGNGGA